VNLLTFAGIIQTVLVGILTTFITNPTFKTNFLANSNNTYILILISLGFIAYIATALLSAVALWEFKWKPAPVTLEDKVDLDWAKQLKKLMPILNQFQFSFMSFS
jgi:prepilin signal peptidase PulO-like enzyme (type II secretory pathway)